MIEYVIGGVAIIPLVIGIVEFLKETTPLQGNACRLVGFGLAGALTAVGYCMQAGIIPEAYHWIPTVIVVFLGGGMSASGLYDLAKRYRPAPAE